MSLAIILHFGLFHRWSYEDWASWWICSSPTEDLLPHLSQVCNLISNEVESGGTVLVHCVAGVSRWRGRCKNLKLDENHSLLILKVIFCLLIFSSLEKIFLRSASFVLAYLISTYNLTLNEVTLVKVKISVFQILFNHKLQLTRQQLKFSQALCHLKLVRPWVNPNKGFLSQLRTWENEHLTSKRHWNLCSISQLIYWHNLLSPQPRFLKLFRINRWQFWGCYLTLGPDSHIPEGSLGGGRPALEGRRRQICNILTNQPNSGNLFKYWIKTFKA